jgi:hypothetical protein
MGVAATALVAGCGGAADTLPRQPVSGTVKFKGEPLKSGMIQFQPDSPSVTTAGGSGVIDGKYAVPRSEGLVPGKYKVMISSTSGSLEPAKPSMPGDPPPPAREPIPAKYNSSTELTAEVKQEGPNTFDFDLKAN